MKNIEQMIRKIALIDSCIDFNDFFADLKNIFHYSWAGFVVFEPSSSKHYQAKFFGQLPTYLSDFIRQDDHIKRYCLNESTPINYRELFFAEKGKNKLRLADGVFNQEQVELVVPINGLGSEFSCFIFSIPQHWIQTGLLEKLGWYWLMLSPFIYSRYRKKVIDNQNPMTKRELECIKWAAEGKTAWEISQLLTISQRTVEFHLANCISKTDSINRQQAIVKCILKGQLLAV